jgi:predicted RNA polymerase sigma factor
VLHVLYLIFNEGYASTAGPTLGRADLADEGIRLARMAYAALPDDPEVAALLALMLLTDARRAARTRPDGSLVPLASQDRRLWDRALILEGVRLITAALRMGQVGEYQLQAAIAGCHDQAPSDADTDWLQIVSLYGLLETMTRNPMVALNRAVATSRVQGPTAGLRIVDRLTDQLRDHHRLHAVRAHLLEEAGDVDGAIAEFKAAAARTTNVAERDYLTTQAARLLHGG